MKNPKNLLENVEIIYSGGTKPYEDAADYIEIPTKAVRLG
jgi:hypothetical protein